MLKLNFYKELWGQVINVLRTILLAFITYIFHASTLLSLCNNQSTFSDLGLCRKKSFCTVPFSQTWESLLTTTVRKNCKKDCFFEL